MLHDAISSWRTADITQADKENLFHFLCQFMLQRYLFLTIWERKGRFISHNFLVSVIILIFVAQFMAQTAKVGT
jgi:hypothetical protein